MSRVNPGGGSAKAPNKVLSRMLDRLFASLVSGPSLNCRPHSSRQRVDLSALSRLRDIEPHEVLRALIGKDHKAKVTARVRMPAGGLANPHEDIALAEQRHDSKIPVDAGAARERAAHQAWADQAALLNKLRIIAEDARTYEQDTGVAVLNVGFPLLSLPPGALGGSGSGMTRRIIAPIAFVPVNLLVKRGAQQSVEIECRADGMDLVAPNTALLAWLEQQTSKPAFAELFADETGQEPWREICELVKRVCVLMELPVPDVFNTEAPKPAPGEVSPPARPRLEPPASLRLGPSPRADDDQGSEPRIILSAVLGLFPVTNQGLLRDMQSMVAGEDDPMVGPVESFIRADVSLDQPPRERTPDQVVKGKRVFDEERLVANADPCQSRAVKLARQSKGLVIHGPPGTGKSQTITNIIGDHLSRGQRVLLVCDKRTALDVVANRLEHMGLGRLCALVHDPQRDQRELYRMIREQLDALPEAQTNAKAAAKVGKIDEELEELHESLTRHWQSLMSPPRDGAPTFHELMGQWMAIEAPAGFRLDAELVRELGIGDLEKHETRVEEVLRRGGEVQYADNPWVEAAGTNVAEFVARPMGEVRQKMKRALDAARAADATLDPAIPPFAPQVDLAQQARDRAALAGRLQGVLNEADPAIGARWAKTPVDALVRGKARLAEMAPVIAAFRAHSLDAELAMAARMEMPSPAVLGQQIAILDEYLPYAGKWYGFIFFARNKQAGEVTRNYGLPPGPASAQRLRDFLSRLRTRMQIQAACNESLGEEMSGIMLDDVLDRTLRDHEAVLELLSNVRATPGVANLYEAVRAVLANPDTAPGFLSALERSRARAEALTALQKAMSETRLMEARWLGTFDLEARGGKPAAARVESLEQRADALEGVLRTREALAALPPPLRSAARELVTQGAPPEEGLALLRKTVLTSEITGRLRDDPTLQSVDRTAIDSAFERYRKLDDQKKELMRDAILHRWVTRQKERLLAQTGSRLNSDGADLKRRLTLRGEKAMRLRQVVSVGQMQYTAGDELAEDSRKTQDAPQEKAAGEEVDPLFDMCPVWMASPETVAQIFPREPLFDVVVFDEASQCRLEEALPVLTRGDRVVIAGDPKQLPPTRFFESAVALSEDEEIETEQQLFEMQQGEVEDLLGAALNLSIEQCYLDVHYRSRNADLIEFSNTHFYGARLQAIPGHPSNRTQFPPLTLYRVQGLYEKRMNEPEAERVCQIVKDLLKRAKPPSIGIACFNLQQRDLIVEMLEELAADDADFGKRLADARTRSGEGSFEGLFVKNLENVQGDERDHIIISTTYGPDKAGRFYKRFGPLGRAGGGRRLNVLVTRARQEVHVITSIPREVYRALPPVPPGQAPGGAYLLFAYLKYAEELAEAYEDQRAAQHGESLPAALMIESDDIVPDVPETPPPPEPQVRVRQSKYPSSFAEALGRHLVRKGKVGTDVHWGNEGFSVDLALHHPRRPEDVTLGVLVDGSRFAQAEDPVEWDIFRTAIHESQGWNLHRLWTPHFFRDPEGTVDAILTSAAREAATLERKAPLTPSRSKS